METKGLSLLLLLASFVFFSTLTAFIIISGNDGGMSREGAQGSRARRLKSFSNIFPDRNLVLDMMQLSADIFDVREDVSPEEAISNPKFQFEDWIEADFSTTSMIVTFQNEKEGLQEAASTIPVVVFRGSDDFDDWLVNLNVVLVKSEFTNAPSDVEVHRGFQSALFDQNIVEDIEKIVLKLVGEDGDVIVTGHSLGGANAHITATYLADRNPNLNIQMINFGAPRLGNNAFKLWTETKLENLSAWRFVYRRDIVPRIVPRGLGYKHAGHLSMLYRSNSKTYYRQVGDGVSYVGAPWNWYYATSYREHPHPIYLRFIKDIITLDRYWPTDFEKRSWREILIDLVGV